MPISVRGHTITDDEIELEAIRAQGAGGQNVNKVSTAIHLRFDVATSSLDEEVKAALLKVKDQRISKDGVIVIKAQRFRSQEKNRADAMDRLRLLLESALDKPKPRRATKPTKASQRRRMDQKNQRSQIKAKRGRVSSTD